MLEMKMLKFLSNAACSNLMGKEGGGNFDTCDACVRQKLKMKDDWAESLIWYWVAVADIGGE